MQVFATFDHSTYIELAIRKLEQKGIDTIFVVPLDSRKQDSKIFDTIHQSDGISLLNKGMFLAVIFSVIGASRGFILEWGPIIWGLIGAGSGFVLGFLIDLILIKVKHRNIKIMKGKKTEVILIVECKDEHGEMVEEILWAHLAFGVAKIK